MITVKRNGQIDRVSLGNVTPYVNKWCECNKCGDVHRIDDRVWKKQWKLDVSSCPACGHALMAPEANIKRQINLFEEEAA